MAVNAQYNIFSFSESFGANIREGLFKMAEKLGETSEDHQRELLSAIESSGGYQPPAISSTCSSVEAPKYEQHIQYQKIESKPGTQF